MSILSKYIARKFWGPFIFIICIFTALIFLGDSIEKMRWVSTYSAPVRMVFKYSLLTMPSMLLQVLPVACLLSALLVITDMINSGEWTACLAGGFTVRQIFGPIIICIAFAALLGFIFQEFAVPAMYKRANLILQVKIRRRADWKANIQHDVTLRLDANRVLFAKTVRPDEGLMQGMFIDVYDDNRAIERQINARRFSWDAAAQTWYFEGGFIRYFGRGASVREEPFSRLPSDFSIPPDQITLGDADPDALSIREILRRIAFLKASGLSTFQEYTFLNAKLAAPFATLVMCLLGMPLSIALKRSNKLLNIVCAVAIGFTFWWIVSLLNSAGESGIVSPVAAGWLPVSFFAVIAFIEFKLLKI
ncbi:MAG: LptF/LptG family permease [Elusimicrobiota bacterium]|jgi:lipopolysaccharide export system permease protein|nr:LptF/LptG family permease [Elusimicrobiota bacterium]